MAYHKHCRWNAFPLPNFAHIYCLISINVQEVSMIVNGFIYFFAWSKSLAHFCFVRTFMSETILLDNRKENYWLLAGRCIYCAYNFFEQPAQLIHWTKAKLTGMNTLILCRTHWYFADLVIGRPLQGSSLLIQAKLRLVNNNKTFFFPLGLVLRYCGLETDNVYCWKCINFEKYFCKNCSY